MGEVGDRLRPALVVWLGLLLLTGALMLVTPDLRHHVLGGTERRETVVLSAEERTRSEDNDRVVAHYELLWRDDEGVDHVSTFKRAGPVRRQPGETWTLWVSPTRPSSTHTESPWVTRLWIGIGLPLGGLLIGLLWSWRQRVLERSMMRGIARQADSGR